MFNQSGERTLISAIVPPKTAHIHAVLEVALKNIQQLPILAGTMVSLPVDFYIKTTGKGSGGLAVLSGLPLIDNRLSNEIKSRALMLNCLNRYYSNLWEVCWNADYVNHEWSKNDLRLSNSKFLSLDNKWRWNTPLRTDYERRQALVELDVLTAMALGMTLGLLKTIYNIQFPVLQSYENDTWYDANGRIAFTVNRSLTGVGFERKEWENGIKGAPAGKKFYRIITDDTMPGGPVERTIEYVAPFEHCDREKDYDTAWIFFTNKYKGEF